MHYEVILWKKRWDGLRCCFCGEEVAISEHPCRHVIFTISVSGHHWVTYIHRTGAVFVSAETLEKYFRAAYSKSEGGPIYSTISGYRRIVDAVSLSSKFYLKTLYKIEFPAVELDGVSRFMLFGFSDNYM